MSSTCNECVTVCVPLQVTAIVSAKTLNMYIIYSRKQLAHLLSHCQEQVDTPGTAFTYQRPYHSHAVEELWLLLFLKILQMEKEEEEIEKVEEEMEMEKGDSDSQEHPLLSAV